MRKTRPAKTPDRNAHPGRVNDWDSEEENKAEPTFACRIFNRFETCQMIDTLNNQDFSMEESRWESDEEDASEISPTKRKAKSKLVINVASSQYAIVRECARQAGFIVSEKEEGEFDLLWTDNGIQPDWMAKMKGF